VLQKTHGKWPGGKEFIKIMSSIKLDAVRGPVSIVPMRNPIQNIYIKKVEKKKMFGYPKAELWNTVIKTYPHVTQFGKYDPQKYLKQPPYSRDYPPCKYCE
jgi:branched-chain amino acid transport system substrate-binding protein